MIVTPQPDSASKFMGFLVCILAIVIILYGIAVQFGHDPLAPAATHHQTLKSASSK